MELTKEILKKIAPYASMANIEKYIEPLNRFMVDFAINTAIRQRHFIAQAAHESGSFNYVLEQDSGAAYEGRRDLGNIYAGDGIKFKGRGWFQITGRNNYKKCSNDLLGNDQLLNDPTVLEQPNLAVESACWYWQTHGLNEIADTDNIELITHRINGGLNGFEQRKQFYEKCKLFII
jgi:putative chitinase